MKKLWASSTFQLILLTMTATALVAYSSEEFTWSQWVAQLDMYITGYVIKEAVRYGAAAYAEKGA